MTALLTWGGCQQQPLPTATVSIGGTVRLDGAPLTSGTITFVPLGSSEGVTVEIKDGSQVRFERHASWWPASLKIQVRY